MAIAHENFVWDYVVCDPDPEEMRRYAFLRESAPRTTAGYVTGPVSPDGSYGFVPYDNTDEIWPVNPVYVLVPEEKDVPEIVSDYLFGPVYTRDEA